MPTAAFHSNYWATGGAGTPNDPIGGSGDPSYTAFQTTVIGGPGGFGVSVMSVLWAIVMPAVMCGTSKLGT